MYFTVFGPDTDKMLICCHFAQMSCWLLFAEGHVDDRIRCGWRARSCVWESSGDRFCPDGSSKVLMCTTDLLHDDNLFVTDVQMEDGGDQAEVKTCFSEGGRWGWGGGGGGCGCGHI